VRTIGKAALSVAAAAALTAAATACSGGSSTSTAGTTAKTTNSGGCKIPATGVVGLPGYQVCLFVAATTAANHPDSILVDGSHVWVGWQNVTAKDGSDTKSSTISEYTTNGALVKSWSVGGGTNPGTGCHTDGMRIDPATHKLWVMCNEDGNPRLFIIDPMTSSPTQITLPKTPHGGGFDDVQFVNGLALIDASNPTLNKAGLNPFPALYKVTLSGTTAKLTPVLSGQPTATTIKPPQTTVKLNLTDPDSMMIDPQGNFVLDSQGDSLMLWIKNVGTKQQTVSVLSVGTQVDDSVFPTQAKGCVLVSDNASGVYSVCSSIWVPGSAYTDAPNDSGVIGFVGTLGLSSGLIQPIIVGISNPHGMAFLPK
jgi:hypothetical protein